MENKSKCSCENSELLQEVKNCICPFPQENNDRLEELKNEFIAWNKRQSPSGIPFFIADWWLAKIREVETQQSINCHNHCELAVKDALEGKIEEMKGMAKNKWQNTDKEYYFHIKEFLDDIIQILQSK